MAISIYLDITFRSGLSFSSIIIPIQVPKTIIEAISAAQCLDYPPYCYAEEVAILQGAWRILDSRFSLLLCLNFLGR